MPGTPHFTYAMSLAVVRRQGCGSMMRPNPSGKTFLVVGAHWREGSANAA